MLAMMANQKTFGKGSKTARFVIGRDRFAKIAEVEGVRLTAEMKKRASEAETKGLTAEEYRRSIIRNHRKS